jgi:hypothetical protein
MMRYAGIPLLVPSEGIVGHVLGAYPDGVFATFSGRRLADERLRRLEPGTLYWPADASRHAAALVLADRDQLDAIKANTLRGGPHAEELEISDGQQTVKALLWMLPAVTLSSDPTSALYLIPLVDQRWLWQRRLAYVSVAAVPTWSQVLGQYAAAVGDTISAAAAATAYLVPGQDCSSDGEPAAARLDGVAASCGQRVLAELDGTFRTLTAADAQVVQANNLKRVQALAAGGRLRLQQPGGTECRFLLPGAVAVTFPVVDDGAATQDTYTVTIATGTLAGLSGRPVGTGAVNLAASTAAARTAGVITNALELAALAQQAALDWCLWRLGSADLLFDGVALWDPDGLSAVEWRQKAAGLHTLIRRDPPAVPPLLTSAGAAGTVGAAISGPISFLNTVQVAGPLYLEQEAPIVVNADLVDWDLSGKGPVVVVNVTGAPRFVRSIKAPSGTGSGEVFLIINKGPYPLVLMDEDAAASLTSWRINTHLRLPIWIFPDTSRPMRYDKDKKRWRDVDPCKPSRGKSPSMPLADSPPNSPNFPAQANARSPVQPVTPTTKDIVLPGIAGGTPGMYFVVENTSDVYKVTLKDQDSSVPTDERFDLGGSNHTIPPKGFADVWKDPDTGYWKLVSASPAAGAGSGTVTQVDTGTGLTGGPIFTTGTVSLADTAVSPGTYGDSTHVAQFTVDQQGRLIFAGNIPISGGGGGYTPGGAYRVPAADASGTALTDYDALQFNGSQLTIGDATGTAVELYLRRVSNAGPAIIVMHREAAGGGNTGAGDSLGLIQWNGTPNTGGPICNLQAVHQDGSGTAEAQFELSEGGLLNGGKFYLRGQGRLGLNTTDWGGGTGAMIALHDAAAVPSLGPTGGGVLYSESGRLKWMRSSGTIDVLGGFTSSGPGYIPFGDGSGGLTDSMGGVLRWDDTNSVLIMQSPNGRLDIGDIGSGSGSGPMVSLADVGTAPSINPFTGGILYADGMDSHRLKWHRADGAVNVLGQLDYVSTPSTSLSPGSLGQCAVDSSYFYVYNEAAWGRILLDTAF